MKRLFWQNRTSNVGKHGNKKTHSPASRSEYLNKYSFRNHYITINRSF
jgi:hypothetical protein